MQFLTCSENCAELLNKLSKISENMLSVDMLKTTVIQCDLMKKLN